MEGNQASLNHEKPAKALNGWGMLTVVIVILLAGLVALILAGVYGKSLSVGQTWALVGPGLALLLLGGIFCAGFFTLEPNETRVLVLFGAYKGTVRAGGFHWANPFYSNGPAAKTAPDDGPGRGQRHVWSEKDESDPHDQEIPQVQDLRPCADPQRAKTQGQRQTREPGGDRHCGGVAGPGHGPSRLRCRRSSTLRGDAERDRTKASGQLLRVRPRRGA